MNPTNLSLNVDDLKSQASDAVRKVGDTFAEKASLLRDTAAGVRYDTQDFIESNPWQAIGIAAAVGFVLGVIVARR
jgi:ElaB/YqjD/DUF883 family membrane-anchored ribosome-binding protein